ncbi:MAG: hypothetical protein ACOCX1_06450 [Fimbriimonadaceae bacterium]
MQKRSTPTVLIAVVVLLLVGAGLYNMRGQFQGEPQDPFQPEEAQTRDVSEEERENTTENLEAQLDAASEADSPEVTLAQSDEPEEPQRLRPTILLPPKRETEITYNENATSTMFWEEESHKRDRAQELQGGTDGE